MIYNNDIANKTADIIWSTNSYKYKNWDDKKMYKWKHNLDTPCYCDCRNINNFPKETKEINGFLSNFIKSTFYEPFFIIGMSKAGIPWATRIADTLNLPVAYTKIQEKTYSDGAVLENLPTDIMRAIIIDDSCVTGKSIAEAIIKIQAETDIKIIGILTITNWNFNVMRETLEVFNIPINSLTSYQNILERGRSRSFINSKNYQLLLDFYQSNSN